MLRKCEYTKGDVAIEDFLNGDGRGVEVMKLIESRRLERREEEKEREKDPL